MSAITSTESASHSSQQPQSVSGRKTSSTGDVHSNKLRKIDNVFTHHLTRSSSSSPRCRDEGNSSTDPSPRTFFERSASSSPRTSLSRSDSESPRNHLIASAHAYLINIFGEKSGMISLSLLEFIDRSDLILLSNSWSLSYALVHEGELTCFLSAIHQIIKQHSEACGKFIENTDSLLIFYKTALQIIAQPCIPSAVNNDPRIKEIANKIIEFNSLFLRTPEIQDLYLQARNTLNTSVGSIRQISDVLEDGVFLIKHICLKKPFTSCRKILNEITEFQQKTDAKDNLNEKIKFFLKISKSLLESEVTLKPIQKNNLIRACLEVIINPLSTPIFDILLYKKHRKVIVELALENNSFTTLTTLANYAEKTIDSKFIGLKTLLILIKFIHNPSNDKTARRCYNELSKIDPEGHFFIFTVNQIEKLQKEFNSTKAPIYLEYLIDIADTWYNSKTNKELIKSPKFQALGGALSQIKNTLSTSQSGSFLKRSSLTSPPNIEPVDDPATEFRESASEEIFTTNTNKLFKPNKHKEFWLAKSAVKELHDSIVTYLGKSWYQVTKEDLSENKRTESNRFFQHSKRFNQISQFVCSRILYCETLFNAQCIIHVLTKVQKHLLKNGVFDGACAIHAGLHQASISRLFPSFRPVTNFSSLFESEEAVCHATADSKLLREKQSEHSHPIEFSGLIAAELERIHAGNEDFTPEGVLNIEKIDLLNNRIYQITIKQLKAKKFWESQTLSCNDYLIKSFKSHSGIFKEVDDDSWKKSECIHPLSTHTYWGRPIEN